MSDYVCVPPDHAGLELDELLALLYPDLNKGFLRREVRAGRVRVDGARVRPSHRVRDGEVLILDIAEEDAPPSATEAPPVPLEVLHEDADVLVIDKPAGLATEPERWARDRENLAGSLVWHARGDAAEAGLPLPFRPRIVHRLDKDTSGCLVAAKNLATERRLRRAFEEGEVEKDYLALVEGEHPLGDGEEETIDLPVGQEGRRGRQSVADGGKPARTRVRVERRFRGYSLLRCSPITGRTHQIRVHLAETGFPLVVDPLYGRRDAFRLSEFKRGYRPKPGRPERPLVDRLTLHAARIAFPTADGERLAVTSPLPADLERVLKQLAKVRPLRR